MNDKQPEALGLSARVRPNVEAAPWVCEEIAKQEAELRRLYEENAELLDVLKRIRATGVFVGAIPQAMMDEAIEKAEGRS